MSPPPLQIAVVPGALALDPEAWNALVDPDDPFMEHGFLAALERSGSVGPGSGWQPLFVVARQQRSEGPGALVGALPLYLKDHSYGEYIFDWAWANASIRSGLPYYPKLVGAVPFTPATGSRLLTRPDADRPAVTAALLAGARRLADETEASSIHILFCTEDESRLLAGHGYAPRLTLQFHWANRAPEPYRDFDDFLGAFRSRNRKQVRRERAVAAGHGLRLCTLTGPELSARDWRALEGFYDTNVDKHGGQRYLTPAFFDELRRHLPHRVVATMAYRGDEPVAGTLNFERGRALYGRYWGCTEEQEMLHFELCYYRLIERAIERVHRRFEAGAQGEHKLKRGLDPARIHSAHWLRHGGLFASVARYLETEARAMEAEIAEYQGLSPYARV